MSSITNECQSFLKENKGKTIVFTNGCFDILHRGHLTYLKSARELGDRLIIGLNSDESIKKLKGDKRPINCLEDRKLFLESLKFVDFVEPFYEDTPVEILKEIKPTIFVKGGDYDIKTIPEYPIIESYGGKAIALEFVNGHSTTDIIKRILELNA